MSFNQDDDTGMMFRGPRIAVDGKEARAHHMDGDVSQLAPLIVEALDDAEIALVLYAKVRGELLCGRYALKKLRELRDKL